MLKKTFLFGLLFFYNLSSSQNIEIGQDSQIVKQLVEWSTKNNNKSDSFGNRANSYWTYDTQYKNGVLIEVYQCYENQYLIDFKLKADFCKHFIMKNNKLSHVLSQYENISIEKLNEIYNSMYSDSKIDNFYFFNDYQNYSKIYLADNGLATIEMRKTIMSELPKSVQQTLTSKLAELKDKEILKQKAYEPNARKMLSSPQPNNDCSESGKVVVQISVNRLGEVIKTTPGINGTTNNAKCLLERAKQAAMSIKMEANQNAPEVEVRKISYTFN